MITGPLHYSHAFLYKVAFTTYFLMNDVALNDSRNYALFKLRGEAFSSRFEPWVPKEWLLDSIPFTDRYTNSLWGLY